MTDWVTISSLATAGGTLVLAVATFQSVQSANRSARIAERSLLEGVRPVLIPSRDTDPTEQVHFGDDVNLAVPGHGGAAKIQDGSAYMAMALRNGGSGLAVIHGWRARAQAQNRSLSGPVLIRDSPTELTSAPVQVKPDINEFRRQQLDLYIPAGETGYWQGALRDPGEPGYDDVLAGLGENRNLWIDVLYGDSDGGQRSIVRMLLSASPERDGYRTTVLRYWNVDRADPR